VQLKNSAYSWT